MKHFVVEIETLKNGTQAQSITEKTTADEAVASFHSTIGYAMQNEDCAHAFVMAINDDGGIYKSEAWSRNENA